MPDGSELQFVQRLDGETLVGWSYGPVETEQGDFSLLTTTYFDTNFEWSGNLVVLKDGETILEQTETNIIITDSGTQEVSSYTDNVGGTQQTNTYNYDVEGNFTGGTEFDGIKTVEFDSGWQIISQSISTEGRPVVSDDTIPTGALDISDGSINYEVTEELSESLTEVTYINQDGKIVGSATISTETIGENTVTFTSYFDENGTWVGDKYDDGYLTDSYEKSFSENGSFAETGSSIELDGNGDTVFASSFSFSYDADGNFLGGEETFDGITRQYDENWTITGTTLSAEALEVLEENLVSIEAEDYPMYELGESGFYSEEEISDSFTERTIYDESYGVVGYVVEEVSLTDTRTAYHDETWGFLGEIVSSPGEDGQIITRTFYSTVAEGVRTDHSEEIVTLDGEVIESFISAYDFSLATGAFLGGSESKNDVLTVFDENWTITSTGLSAERLAELDRSTLHLW